MALAFATTALLHPSPPPREEEGRKCPLVSLYMTENQPFETPRRACHHSNQHSRRRDGVRRTLERHPFSELFALAGELLHIPWQISTFMTTVPLLPANSILKRGSTESALRHPRHVFGAPRIACTAYQYGPAESPGYSVPEISIPRRREGPPQRRGSTAALRLHSVIPLHSLWVGPSQDTLTTVNGWHCFTPTLAV